MSGFGIKVLTLSAVALTLVAFALPAAGRDRQNSSNTILCSGYHRWADIKPSDYPVHMFRESDVRALVYRMRESLHRKRLAQKGVYLESIFSTLHGSGACASYYINERSNLSEGQVHKLISFGSSDMVRFSKSLGQLLKSK